MNKILYKDYQLTIEKGCHGSLLIWFHGELALISNKEAIKALVNGYKEMIE